MVLEAKLKDAEGELENLRKENTVLKRVLKEIANLSLNAPNLTSLSDEAVPLNMLASSSPISSNTSGAYSLEVSMSAPCPSLRDDRPGFDYQPEKPRQEAKSKGSSGISRNRLTATTPRQFCIFRGPGPWSLAGVGL